MQDTGFARWPPAGEGVLAFHAPVEVLAKIEEVEANFEAHCQAAKTIADEYFNYRKVLPALIEQALFS